MLPEPKKDSLLIIDDNKINLQVIASTLSQQNYALAFSFNAEHARGYLEKMTPDLILLDIMMPGMNGVDFCKELKQDDRLKAIPVIFVTAKTEYSDLAEAFQAGGVDYITKPFNKGELIIRVETHLALKRAKEDLQNSLAMKDKLMSIIAHDLRGPLGSVLSILHMLKDNTIEITQEQQSELIVMLEATTDGAYTLLENMLEWSRTQAGSVDIDRIKMYVDEIIYSSLTPLLSLASEKNIDIKKESASDIAVYCDPKLLSTVIRNLVSNAIKFTPQNGSINIEWKKVEHECIISVKDTGIGMDTETQQKIFQSDTHYTTYGTNSEKGTGLGLGICMEFTKLNNGKLWVESELGHGSCFYISVPLA